MLMWGADNLTGYLRMASLNQQANAERFSNDYHLLWRVNECLALAGANLVAQTPVMPSVLFQRTQYAYKAAAGMALSGQVVETFAVMRLCLESAGYALVIFETPSLESVFMSRHLSDAEMKTQKQAFTVSNVRNCLERFDPQLNKAFKVFYDRTIDFGGHPNPHGAMSAVKIDEDENAASFTVLALSIDEPVVRHAIKSVTQVGLTVLCIFEFIFTLQFEFLEIRKEIAALKQANL
jgi:hypothetical protein